MPPALRVWGPTEAQCQAAGYSLWLVVSGVGLQVGGREALECRGEEGVGHAEGG